MMHLTPNHDYSPELPTLSEDMDMSEDKIDVQDISVLSGDLSSEFTILDPDLAVIHKDLQSAIALFESAKKSGHGIEAAMANLESLQGIYQTRLLEVRESKLNNDARLASDSEKDIDARKALHAQTMQDRMNEAFNRRRDMQLKKKKREEQKQGGLFFYILLGMWVANMTRQQQMRLEQDLKKDEGLKASFSASKSG